MKIKVIILMLSLLFSCTHEEKKQIKKEFDKREEKRIQLIDTMSRSMDIIADSILLSTEKVDNEYEQVCHH